MSRELMCRHGLWPHENCWTCRIAELEEEDRQYFNNEVALRKRIAELEAIIYRLVDPCMATENEEKIILEISQRQEVNDA